MTPMQAVFLPRFWSKVIVVDSGCWLWTSSPSDRYARFSYIDDGKKINGQSHRMVYELFGGPIPDGLTIDHLCRVTKCVNPAHLEAVPIRVNILRSEAPPAVNARKTTCLLGHPLDAKRKCVPCRQAKGRADQQRLRDRRRAANPVRTCDQCGKTMEPALFGPHVAAHARTAAAEARRVVTSRCTPSGARNVT